MIEPAVRQRQVRDYSEVLETDLATLFKAMRADVMNALKQDDPLGALEKIFGDLSADEADDAPDTERLDVLKTIEQDVSRLVEKVKTKPGKYGTLELVNGHYEYIDKPGKAERSDFYVKKDIQLEDGFSIKAGSQMTHVQVMAFGNKIGDVSRLVRTYPLPNGKPTKPEDWEKAKGITYITDGKMIQKAEIHWYQCNNIGKIEHKRKKEV